MTLRSSILGALALACLALSASGAQAACTPTTTPNTSGVTANAQLELLQEICARETTPTLPSGAALDASVTAMSAKLPASLGAKTGANSLSVTPATDAAFVLGAGENHIGEVGGKSATIAVAQTVTASSAYASGNAVGGLITVAGAARVAGVGGLIQSVAINSKSAQTGQIDVVFFNANPTGSTCTDKTALSVASADFDKIIGVAHVTDWTSLGTPSVGQAQGLAMPFALAAGTTLYACAVTRSTPTFASTSDISVATRVLQN